jgi:short-subunit dehydrogenase
MRPPIDGGHVLITGASSGIGHALALELAPRARALSLVARREDRLLELKAALLARNPALRVGVFACDLLDRAAVDRMLEEAPLGAGPVDVLINNAGFGDFGSYEAVSWEKTEDMLMLNVTVLAYLTRRLLPSMVERGRGGVLNVSSGFGLSFMPGFAGYVGTKHFVTGFTECLRLEMRPKGVVVSQLCPGPVTTEFLEIARMGKAKPPGIATVSAEQCARAAVHGFDADRAIIIPGIVMKTVLALGALTPRWVLRLLYRPFVRPFVGTAAKRSE